MGTVSSRLPRSEKAELPQNHLTVFSAEAPTETPAEALKKWLAIFHERYHQEATDLSTTAYRIGLEDLSATEINMACLKALKTSVAVDRNGYRSSFIPTVAVIRDCLRACYEQRPAKFSRDVAEIPRLPLTNEEERELEEISNKTRKTLGLLTKSELRAKREDLQEQKRIILERYAK